MAEQLICNQQVDGSTPFTSSIFHGGIPERPKGADCKSVVTDFAGPNPASPTKQKYRPMWSVFLFYERSCWHSVGLSDAGRIPTLIALVSCAMRSKEYKSYQSGTLCSNIPRIAIPSFPHQKKTVILIQNCSLF